MVLLLPPLSACCLCLPRVRALSCVSTGPQHPDFCLAHCRALATKTTVGGRLLAGGGWSCPVLLEIKSQRSHGVEQVQDASASNQGHQTPLRSGRLRQHLLSRELPCAENNPFTVPVAPVGTGGKRSREDRPSNRQPWEELWWGQSREEAGTPLWVAVTLALPFACSCCHPILPPHGLACDLPGVLLGCSSSHLTSAESGGGHG